MSSIQPWFSDTLCKAVTGDGIVERALFTDDDISVISFRRCIALTTIDAGRLAGDLAERLLAVELARIPTEPPPPRRRDHRRLRRRPAPHLGCPPRPHRRGRSPRSRSCSSTSCPAWPTSPASSPPSTSVRGWDTLASYRTAAAEATQAVLESDPVAEAVIALIGRGGGWQGTASELLDRITPERRPRGWPQTPRGLSGALARLAPALRAHGVIFERHTRGLRPARSRSARTTPAPSNPRIQPSRPSRPSRDLP